MESILSSDIAQMFLRNLPLFIPVVTGLVVCLIDLVWKEEEKDVLGYVAFVGIVILIASLWHLWLANYPVFYLGFSVSKFSLAMMLIISFLSVLSLLLGLQYYSEKGRSATNFAVYLLFTTFGLLTTLATSNLIMIFVGLTITSISLIYLVKLYGDFPGEGSVQKLWIYMLVTDLLFCLGIAFFYGATGKLDIQPGSELLVIINEFHTGGLFKISIAILGLSLMAKMAAVPFHWWNLDFINSNSLPLINLISVFYRAATMLLAIKVFAPIVSIWGQFFEVPLMIIAIITMTWANLAAVRVRDLRALLVYSLIAHVGYFLTLFPTLMLEGGATIVTLIIFIVALSFIHLGAFALLYLFSSEGVVRSSFENLDGMGKRQPWISLALCLFLFALAGAPPMVTFLARLMVIREIASGGNYLVLAAIVINMAIAVFYYLRPITRIYLFKPTKHVVSTTEVSYSLITVIVFSAIIALYLGIQPTSFIHWIQLSVAGM